MNIELGSRAISGTCGSGSKSSKVHFGKKRSVTELKKLIIPSATYFSSILDEFCNYGAVLEHYIHVLLWSQGQVIGSSVITECVICSK